MYIAQVIPGFACPSNLLMVVMGTPMERRWLPKLCLRLWNVSDCGRPALSFTRLKTRVRRFTSDIRLPAPLQKTRSWVFHTLGVDSFVAEQEASIRLLPT